MIGHRRYVLERCGYHYKTWSHLASLGGSDPAPFCFQRVAFQHEDVLECYRARGGSALCVPATDVDGANSKIGGSRN